MKQNIPILVCILALAVSCFGMYLPGIAPKEYADGDSVKVKVIKLASAKTQIPYAYYSLKFIQPPGGVQEDHENLGEILFGDRTENTPYEVQMRKNIGCMPIGVTTFTDQETKDFVDKIDDDYHAEMIVDELPVASAQNPQLCGAVPPADSSALDDTYYSPTGFPIGCVVVYDDDQQDYFLNNHIHFVIKYHFNERTAKYRVVGVSAYPVSISHTISGTSISSCNPDSPLQDLPKLQLPKTKTVGFSYSVTWKASPIRWASRWDSYLQASKAESAQIHWFSIINSLMILFFLTGMVAMILMRALHKDFVYYREMENSDDATEETGWKLVHGDVFRAPDHSNIFSALVGTGVQINTMFIITLVFALFGFLSPAIRGALMTAMLFLFVFMGIVSGYTSSRLYKMFEGTNHSLNTFMTATLVPGVIFAIFTVLNMILAAKGSSGAVSFPYFLALVALWFGISVPLTYLGAHFGGKAAPITHPIETNKIPRYIPDQPWYMRSSVACLVGGVLPFGAVFIEMYFIFTSIWQENFYYVFGFLFVVFLILVITCAEITIVMIYFQLCSEDYHWWWRSLFTSGSSAIYLFLYSLFYASTRLHMHKFVSLFVFMGYSTIFSIIFFVMTACIGFVSSYVFITKIYASIKIA